MDTAHDEPGGRRWIPIAAAAAVLVLAGIGLGVHLGRDRDPAPAPTNATSTTAAPAPATTDDQQPLTTAPTGVTWTIYQTIALPISKTAGPARVDDAIAAGYTHTATGALLAATNEMARVTFALDPQWRAAADAMYAPGDGKTAWVSWRSTQPRATPLAAGEAMQYAGFQFVSYTSSDAAIQLALHGSNPGYTINTIHLRWVDGDWKIVPFGARGFPVISTATATTLDGFLIWRGV